MKTWLILALTGAIWSMTSVAGAQEMTTVELDAPEAEDPYRLDWLVTPSTKYNDDAGFIYGIKTELIRHDPNERPYDWSFQLRLSHSTRNRHDHLITLDAPGLLDKDNRLRFEGRFMQINDALFFGVGNDSQRTDSDRAHQFRLTEPSARVSIQRNILGGDFFVGGGLSFRQSIIDARPGSILATLQPNGVEGGHNTQALLFMGHDSRDHEIVPHSGHMTELYIKASIGPLASTHSYAGIGFNHQSFFELAPWMVLAQRVQAEDLWGDVPFFVMDRMGGIFERRGLGGSFTQRGFEEGRFIGRTKALSNTELRFYMPRLFSDRMCIGFGPLMDVSTVVDADASGRFWEDLNVSGGGEITIGWKRTFIIRFDYAQSREGGLFYIQSRHLF